MKKQSLSIALVILALSTSAVSHGAAYMKIGDIKGEATEQGHSSGLPTGKRQHKPFSHHSTEPSTKPSIKHGPVITIKPKGAQTETSDRMPVAPAPLHGIEPDEIDHK